MVNKVKMIGDLLNFVHHQRSKRGCEWTTCVAVPIFPYIDTNREFKEDQISFFIKKFLPILMYRQSHLDT